MDDQKMSKDMLKFFRINMKSISPQAVPQDFQKEICEAIAKGVINTLKQSKTIGGGTNATGASGIGLVVDSTIMITTATQAMIGFTGGGGVALPKMMESFFIPIAAHLATNTEIKSTSGFGGQGGPPVGAVPVVFEKMIFDELHDDTQKGMKKSKQGMFFIKSLSLGLGAGMSAAIPGFVPMTGTTGGPLVGIFK